MDPVVPGLGCDEVLKRTAEGEKADIVIECGGLVDWSRIAELSRRMAPRSVILLTRQVPAEMVCQARDSGVRGLLDLRVPVAELVRRMERALSGEAVFPETEPSTLHGPKAIRLTPREGQLVTLLVQGLKNKEIAYQLGLSEGTVKVYLSRLFQKVGAKDRFELALFGLRNLANGEFSCVEPARSRKSVSPAPMGRRGLRTLLVGTQNGWNQTARSAMAG
ncbi:MAG: response regulator transcription factor [Bryobacteraceae bacterium]|nr:response regulator transcription factor [Bryobacteraceae bacterium]